MFRGIDFFSDTLTRPSAAMKKAMFDAELGDEQKGEDPTTLLLEQRLAELTGHSAAMFFPCATMANQIAIRAQCEPGDELIAYQDCHLFLAEGGGTAVNSGVQAKPMATPNGIFTGDDVRAAYRWPKGPHYPVSKLVSVENTTNMGGGVPWTLAQLDSVFEAAKELNLKTHMDGARMFNAHVASGLPVRTITSRFDTVTVCFSKGMGCATGAVLCFDKSLWTKIRRLKQVFGGAMRQSGILAAACLYALDHHISRLQEDHDNAKLLAKGLLGLPFIEVENPEPGSNMLFFQWKSSSLSAEQFSELCTQKGVRFSQCGARRFRAVTHLDISTSQIHEAIKIVAEISKSL